LNNKKGASWNGCRILDTKEFWEFLAKELNKDEWRVKIEWDPYIQVIQTEDTILIFFRQYPSGERFALLSSVVMKIGRVYVSTGKNSHFAIPRLKLAKCPNCGALMPPQAIFCGKCGRSLREI